MNATVIFIPRPSRETAHTQDDGCLKERPTGGGDIAFILGLAALLAAALVVALWRRTWP